MIIDNSINFDTVFGTDVKQQSALTNFGNDVKINKYQSYTKNYLINVINSSEMILISKINPYSPIFENNDSKFNPYFSTFQNYNSKFNPYSSTLQITISRILNQNKNMPFNHEYYSRAETEEEDLENENLITEAKEVENKYKMK